MPFRMPAQEMLKDEAQRLEARAVGLRALREAILKAQGVDLFLTKSPEEHALWDLICRAIAGAKELER